MFIEFCFAMASEELQLKVKSLDEAKAAFQEVRLDSACWLQKSSENFLCIQQSSEPVFKPNRGTYIAEIAVYGETTTDIYRNAQEIRRVLSNVVSPSLAVDLHTCIAAVFNGKYMRPSLELAFGDPNKFDTDKYDGPLEFNLSALGISGDSRKFVHLYAELLPRGGSPAQG